MWIKHLAQCLTYSPCVRNASCECHSLNKCLWKEEGKERRRETAGRRKKVSYPISRSRFTSELKGKCPLPCLSGTIFLGLVSPSGCFGGPEVSCWVQCQRTLPGQGVRGRSSWTPGDHKEWRVLSGRTPQPLLMAGPGPVRPRGCREAPWRVYSWHWPVSSRDLMRSHRKEQREPGLLVRGTVYLINYSFMIKCMTWRAQGPKDMGWIDQWHQIH